MGVLCPLDACWLRMEHKTLNYVANVHKKLCATHKNKSLSGALQISNIHYLQ